MRNPALAFAALMLLTGPALADAQDMSAVCSSLKAPVPGQWASYDVTTPNGPAQLRFALVPTTGSGLLLELTMTMDGGPAIMQFDVPSYPYDPSQIRQIVIKAPGQPAMIMPPNMMSMMGSTPMESSMDSLARCMESTYVGRETVQVGSGSYEADHIRPKDADTDVWISTDVPFGIVKAEHGGDSMTLTEVGTGAVSSITETPRQMPSIPGMPGRGRIPGIPR